MWLLQSPVNPKPCGTFSWTTSKSPLSPFSMAAKSLLLPKPRGKKKPSKTSWSSSFPSEPHGPFPHFRTSWFSSFSSEPHGPLSIYLLQSLVVLPFTSEPRGLLLPSEPHGLLPIYFGAAWSPPSPPKPCGPPLLLWSRVVSSLFQSRMVSSSLQSCMVSSLLQSRMVSLPKTLWSSPLL